MKLHKLNCPNCGGLLEMKISDSTSQVFCPYCGQQFFLDDENRTHTINKNISKNININKNINHTKHTINEAEIIKANAEMVFAESEAKGQRNAWIMLVVWFSVIAVIVIGLILGFTISGKRAEKAGKISAGYYQDYEGENYEAVIAQLEARGFTNIDTIELNDAGIAFWKNDTVDSVSVAGDTTFESTDYFYPTDVVIITYH